MCSFLRLLPSWFAIRGWQTVTHGLVLAFVLLFKNAWTKYESLFMFSKGYTNYAAEIKCALQSPTYLLSCPLQAFANAWFRSFFPPLAHSSYVFLSCTPIWNYTLISVFTCSSASPPASMKTRSILVESSRVEPNASQVPCHHQC